MNLSLTKTMETTYITHCIGNETPMGTMEEQMQALHIRPLNTCCCYGYSPKIIPYDMLPSGIRIAEIRRLVHMWVDDMVEQGMRNFLSPMEPGVDQMVAERVIALRSIGNKNLRLIACLTHPAMDRDISLLYRDVFISLCAQADHVLYDNDMCGGRRIRRSVNLLLIKRSVHMLAAYQSGHTPAVLRESKAESVMVRHIRTDLLG